VDVDPVRQRPRRRRIECRRREQLALKLAVIQLVHRPGDADHRGPAQVLTDGRATDPDCHRDLPLAHAQGVAQSQDFANLAHRRSLGGHRISPCMVTTGDRVRDSIADSESFTPASQGGRLRSEGVADFRRNRRPECVGIAGRFASDYAG